MECKKERNLSICTCSYNPCSNKGLCCDCLSYHLKNRELPGCCFSKKAEASYDRTFEHFASFVQNGEI